ncbi:MAG: nucleotidyltransferase domain-containing protein [Clostridium sp.]|uniref:nucleotidyltransferase domain-containing protein n=1 Tax=Clostridium sp. TaxID=1506 RepID=UPI002FC8E82C
MIDENIMIDLVNVFTKYSNVDKVLLFGSRARGDNRENSDIDLCIFGDNINHSTLANIYMDVEDINTLVSFDILSFNDIKSTELIHNILEEGVCIYE